MVFFAYGCCRYDGWSMSETKHHEYKTAEDCKAICAEDITCIASEVSIPNNDNYYCLTFHGSGRNFYTGCDKSIESRQCFKKKGNCIRSVLAYNSTMKLFFLSIIFSIRISLQFSITK